MLKILYEEQLLKQTHCLIKRLWQSKKGEGGGITVGEIIMCAANMRNNCGLVFSISQWKYSTFLSLLILIIDLNLPIASFLASVLCLFLFHYSSRSFSYLKVMAISLTLLFAFAFKREKMWQHWCCKSLKIENYMGSHGPIKQIQKTKQSRKTNKC